MSSDDTYVVNKIRRERVQDTMDSRLLYEIVHLMAKDLLEERAVGEITPARIDELVRGYELTVEREPTKYGIFHIFGDAEEDDYFTDQHVLYSYDNPIHAVIRAHRMNHNDPAEHGVFVYPKVIMDCEATDG